jgi:hypothetical protein
MKLTCLLALSVAGPHALSAGATYARDRPPRQDIRGERVVRITCEPARSYTAYWAGRVTRNLSLMEATTGCDRPSSDTDARAAEFSVLYGHCSPQARSRECLPVLQVQSAPLCERHARLYRQPLTDKPLAYRAIKVRGVPGALFYQGQWILELYGGRTTISIAARQRPLVIATAARVAPAPRQVVPSAGEPITTLPQSTPRLRSANRLRQPSAHVLRRTEPCFRGDIQRGATVNQEAAGGTTAMGGR